MLFEPISIGNLEIKNRIIRSATYEKCADIDGFVTDKIIDLYRALARGGAGLIITANALVHLTGYLAPQQLCIHNDHYIEGLKRLVEAVHQEGGKIALQLAHGGRQCLPLLLGGKAPVAPSAVYDPVTGVMPRELTNDEIWELIEAFASAARRAYLSGFDAIQVHGAHGYLISSFLSPHTNRRNDYWGGDEERRFHFIEEVFRAIRSQVGEGFPVMIKVNADDCLEGGLKIEEAMRIAQRLQYLGFAAIEVSGGMYESRGSTVRKDIDNESKEAYFRDHSRAFKGVVSLPVMLVGGIRSRAVAERLLKEGYADFISLSRPLIREPNLPNRFADGKEKADCISCNGCMRFYKLEYVRCVQV